jgi:hypothetical protein
MRVSAASAVSVMLFCDVPSLSAKVGGSDSSPPSLTDVGPAFWIALSGHTFLGIMLMRFKKRF